MELLLGEQGETLLYGIIGAIVVVVICSVCSMNWIRITPTYKNKVNKSNGEFILNNQDKYPTIEADEVIYAEYQNRNFNCYDYIKAKDCNGKDITADINIYGVVDVFQKGIYKLRCVVVAENQLACTKYVNVIVE